MGKFEKGHKLATGRGKGNQNKTTVEVKRNFQHLFDNNLSSVQEWLDKTARNNPAKALELFLKLAEYVVPKAKQEIELNSKTIIVSVTEKEQ